jgi:hypothetical protein
MWSKSFTAACGTALPFGKRSTGSAIDLTPAVLGQPPVIGVVNSTIVILPDHFDCERSVEDAANLVERRDLNVRIWHKAEVARCTELRPVSIAKPTLQPRP